VLVLTGAGLKAVERVAEMLGVEGKALLEVVVSEH